MQTIINVPGKFKADEYGTPLAELSDIYDDVNNKPLSQTIADINHDELIQSDWSLTNTSAKDYIKNKPTIPDTSNLATKAEVNNKVDKIVGKSLSTNDYTNEDKQKVSNAIISHQDISGKADKSDLQTLTTYVNNKLDMLDDAIERLNGSDVVVVEDRTTVSNPDSQKIYREYGESSFTDWMNLDNGWLLLATYDYPGVTNIAFSGSEKLITSGAVASAIGKHVGVLNEEANDLVHTTIVMGLNIKTGDSYNFRITGTHAGSRILIKANSINGTYIQDNCEIGKVYYKTAEEDIDSFVLYHNGDINVVLEAHTNIKYDVDQQNITIQEISANNDSILELNEEVFSKDTYTIDTTAPNPTYIEKDFYVKKGDTYTITLEAVTNIDANINISTAYNSNVENPLNGTMQAGQIISNTYTASEGIYKIRYSFNTRGCVLKVTTTNQSLKNTIEKLISDADMRIANLENAVYGEESCDKKDEHIWDMQANYELQSIQGSANSTVKFRIENPSDYPIRVRLYYREIHLRSVVLVDDLLVGDRSTEEVTMTIPEEFVSVLYQSIGFYKLNVNLTTLLNPKTGGDSEYSNDVSEKAMSTNVLDPSTLISEKYLNAEGREASDSTYSYTDFIPVKEGQVIVISNDVVIAGTSGIHDPKPLILRYVTAYDSSKTVLPSKGSSNAIYSYTVPAGVSYVRITAKTNVITGTNARINTGGLILPYEPYWSKVRPEGVTEVEHELNKTIQFPLSVLPEYVVNSLSYKALGSFSKGYFCLSDDDGATGIGTYTLPMVIEKDVPVTFCLMKDSKIFLPGNEQYKNMLLDAINNHNCTIALHGGVNWTEYNENQLYNFFNDEKEYWDSLNVLVKAAAIPSHFVNKTIEAVAGGYFGIVRCGYDGQNPDNTPNYEAIRTNNYACIPRSNMYCLPSTNIRSYSLEQWKEIIDWAVENKLLMIAYFHDGDFIESAEDYQARRAVLEGVIDYAKEHITMINLEDIPRLV